MQQWLCPSITFLWSSLKRLRCRHVWYDQLTWILIEYPLIHFIQSTCIIASAPSHEPNTCSESWLASLTTCIDLACSTNPGSSTTNGDTTSNMTVEITPKILYSCQQSFAPGHMNDPPSPTLALQAGDCVNSPYDFQSFIPIIQGTILQGSSLVLYPDGNCTGTNHSLSISSGQVVNEECSFNRGRSVMLVVNGSAQSISDNEGSQSNKHVHNRLDVQLMNF